MADLPYGLGAETLPPFDARLIDPSKERIDTPVDDRGLIDVDQLIQAVQETVDPEYLWPHSLSIHHFYWPEASYPYDKSVDAVSNPAIFRDLPRNKGLVPRVFENWLHQVTLPPPTPNPEVMSYRVEAWRVAKSLYLNARDTVRWEKRARRRAEYVQQNPGVLKEEFDGEDIIGEEAIQDILDHYFRGAEHNVARLERIPPEFRLFDPSKPIQALATELGQLVVPKHLRPQIPTREQELVRAA
jgi:hypothetical protein